MKIILYFLLIITACLAFQSQAESAYIYDKDRIIWTLKGPAKDFGVFDKYVPGSKFQIVPGKSENGFTLVIDDSGRQSWIPSNYLLPSANVLFDKARKDITKQKDDHAKKVKQLQSDIAARAPLEEVNRKLQSKLAKMQNELQILRESNRAFSSRFNREIFFAGGSTVIVGILFGWLFGVRGRKRHDGWS